MYRAEPMAIPWHNPKIHLHSSGFTVLHPFFCTGTLPAGGQWVLQWSWEALERASGLGALSHALTSRGSLSYPQRLCSQTWFLGSCSSLSFWFPSQYTDTEIQRMCTSRIICLLGDVPGVWLATTYLFDQLLLFWPFLLTLEDIRKCGHNLFTLPI